MNIYSRAITGDYYNTQAEADKATVLPRFACVKVLIDCEEGEGLEEPNNKDL